MKAFRIYTQHGCPFCEQALALLKTVADDNVENIIINDDPIILSGLSALFGQAQWPATLVNVAGQKQQLIIGEDLRLLSNAVTHFLNNPRS